MVTLLQSEPSRPLPTISKKLSSQSPPRKCQTQWATQSVNSQKIKRLLQVSREVPEPQLKLKSKDSTTISDRVDFLSQESVQRIDQPSLIHTMSLSMLTTFTNSVSRQRLRTSLIQTTCTSKMTSIHRCERSWLTGLSRSTSSIDFFQRLYFWQ